MFFQKGSDHRKIVSHLRIPHLRPLHDNQRNFQRGGGIGFGGESAGVARILRDDTIDLPTAPERFIELFRKWPLHRAKMSARNSETKRTLQRIRVGSNSDEPFAVVCVRMLHESFQVLSASREKDEPASFYCLVTRSLHFFTMDSRMYSLRRRPFITQIRDFEFLRKRDELR